MSLQVEVPLESSDDILAKYRRRIPASSNGEVEVDLALSSSNQVILHEGNRSRDDPDFLNVDDRLVMDPANVEASFAFQVKYT